VRRVLVALLALAGLAACGNDAVQIRVRNDGPLALRSVWIGATGAHGFGAVPAGTTTSYRRFPPKLAAYRKYDLIAADGRRHLGLVGADWEPAALPPGRYTFAFTVDARGAALRVVPDDPAPPR
jgi:hypothetical protein